MSRQNSFDGATGVMALGAHKWIIVAIAAGLVIGIALLELTPMAAVRLAAVGVIAAQAWLESGTARKLFLASPAFLLAAICVVFYSLLPAVLLPVSITVEQKVVGFIGSDAERYIVAFAMASLLAHLFVVHRFDGAPEQRAAPPRFDGRLANLFIFASVALTAGNVILYSAFPQGAPYVTPLRWLIPPLQAILIVYLLRRAFAGGRGLRIVVGVVVVATVVGLLAVHERKIPIFIVAAAALYWFRLSDLSVKKALVGGAVCAAVGIGIIQAAEAIRTPHTSVVSSRYSEVEVTKGNFARNDFVGNSPWFMFRRVLDGKFILRQMETGDCFMSVIKTHWRDPFIASKQLFWLKGLVPRTLWPDKPNLSLGRDYATRYCRFAIKNEHSSSITLLGQPVIQGGWPGLLLHGGALLAALGGLAWLGRDPRSLSSLTVVALLPWLIDFDQDFALYVANAVKFFLVMSPLLLIAGLGEGNDAAWRLAGKFGFRMR